MSRRSPKSDRSFGTRASGKSGRERVSRGQLIRDRYSTDRYPTAEEFIKAVERNPEYFDPSSESFFPHDYGQDFVYIDKQGLKGVSGTNLNRTRSNRSNWIGDNPIEVDATSDPGHVSASIEAWNNDQGDSVSLVAGVDLIPMGIDININGDVGTIGVDLGMPGDAIGITLGASIDINSGELVGGEIGLVGGGLSVGVNQIRKNGETCTSITVTYFGIGASYQQCRKDDEKPPEPPPEPTPPPEPPPELTPEETENNDFEWPEIPQPPGSGLFPGGPEDNVLFILGVIEGGGEQFIEKYRDLKYSKTWFYAGRLGPGTSGYMHQKWQMGEVNDSTTLIIDEPGNSKYSKFPYLDPPGRFLGGAANIGNMTIRWAGKRKDFDLYYTGPIIESSKAENRIFYAWSSLTCLYAEINDQPVPPPEPPIPEEEEVTCCDLEPVMSLLRKVSKAVGEVGTAVGTDQFPANMPKSFLKNEGTRAISNLAELQVYQLEIMDQLVGKFPIELEIADTDPLTPGDQTKKVILTNLAESIAELFGLAINSASDNAIQTSGVIKNLLEITLVRQAVLQNYYRLDAILDYLGAGLEEDTTTFNSTISMPKDPNNISEDVADFLQQSEIKFAYDKLANPKDTLTAKLLPIQKAADIIKAKYWKGFGKAGGDYLGAIKSWLETYDPKNEQNDTEWKDKIDKILEEYAKDQTGNIDKDRMPVIQNITQIGSEPKPPGA